MSQHPRIFALTALCAATVLALSACGGGSDDPAPAPTPAPAPSPAPAPAPTPAPAPAPGSVTLKGQVAVDGPLQGVQVCLDLNGNGTCDANEPTSAATGADGQYTVSAPEAEAGSAPLIAAVPASTGILGAGTGYVLQRPANAAGGAINPLTTLVQSGIASGMTEASARANAALQLGIAEAKIDGYQDDPTVTAGAAPDSARLMALVTAAALAQGVALQVGDQSAAVSASEQLASLTWSGSGDYFVRLLQTQARAAGGEGATFVDTRYGKTGGVERPKTGTGRLYASAMLTPEGWKQCTDTVIGTTTVGTPSRSTYCEAQHSVGFSQPTPVADQTMTDLVTRWQSLGSSNTINNGSPTSALLGALGSAAFPAGAQELRRTSLVVGPEIQIDNIGTRGLLSTTARTLTELLAAYPNAGANLATAAGTLNLGLGSANDKNMRVTFGAATSATSGAAQYYECDLDASGSNLASPPNCHATTAGSYTIEKIHGENIMRFAGHPAVGAAINYTFLYTDHDWGGTVGSFVYRAHERKPDVASRLSQTMRLDGAAWSAMKTQLGL